MRRLNIRFTLYFILGSTIAFMAASTFYVMLEILGIRDLSARAQELSGNDAGVVDAATRVLVVLVVISIVGSIIGTFMTWFLTAKITRPLGMMTRALAELSKGNIGVEVPETGRLDEIGDMARAFDVFRRNAEALKTASEAAEAAERRALALARHDALTGLPNRRVFAEEINRAVAQANRSAATYAVLVVDLDHFKPVNDLHGHAMGDSVLCGVAERIKAVVRKNDTFARLGGDEFAIISETSLGSENSAEAAIRLANRVIAAVHEQIVIRGVSLTIDATIGIAQCPTDGCDAEALLHAADMAMYRAKREGRGVCRFFEPSMDAEVRARAALETELRNAIAAEAIVPYYQPLVELASDRLLGFEVLARWNHPQRGFIPPDAFIPMAEELGLIAELTSTLLRTACCEAKDWPTETILSVNVSPLQLKDRLLPAKVLSILTETGFPAHRLELEITENALVSDLATAKTILTSFQNIGIKVALDDFGTGYSSMYHLRELRFDKIKVDRSFVQSMRKDPESARVVTAILGLTRSLGLPTIAEGIEDGEIAEQLAESGCEFGQGFHFGKAMPASAVLSLIETRSNLERAPVVAAVG